MLMNQDLAAFADRTPSDFVVCRKCPATGDWIEEYRVQSRGGVRIVSRLCRHSGDWIEEYRLAPLAQSPVSNAVTIPRGPLLVEEPLPV